MARQINVALLGNPNTGKTSVFNRLTGLNQKVGNYPGITVEKKEGICTLERGLKAHILDLPGTYSLNASSLDENVVIERFPVSFSREEWRDSARAYATLRSLNIHNELSDQLFQSVQDLRMPIGNEQDFVAWLSKRTTLSEPTILNAYNHDKVDELMAMYKAAERRYAITSVPSIYVNGNIQVKLKALEGETQLDKMIFLNSLIDHLLLLKH